MIKIIEATPGSGMSFTTLVSSAKPIDISDFAKGKEVLDHPRSPVAGPVQPPVYGSNHEREAFLFEKPLHSLTSHAYGRGKNTKGTDATCPLEIECRLLGAFLCSSSPLLVASCSSFMILQAVKP